MNDRILEIRTDENGKEIIMQEVRNGDILRTKEQIEGYEKFKQKRFEKNFIFALYERCEEYMKDYDFKLQDITRIIMLSTYCDYNGRIMFTERTAMDKTTMKKVLRESSQERFNLFHNMLLDSKILYKNDEGVYILSSKYFNKGETKIENFGATRLFIKEIRYLFEHADVRDFKRLGYIFKLLPYISKDFNFVCSNPTEQCLDLVRPMNATEISEVLNIERTTLLKALKELRKIQIDGKYMIGWFVMGNSEQIKLIINPHVFYAGATMKEINIIGKLFEIC